MGNIMKRTPPHSIEAESSLLGACLLSEHISSEALSTLTFKDFYDLRHQTIFKSMEQLAQNGSTIDLVTVCGAFQDKLEQIGGAGYLASLTEVIPAPTGARSWAKIISKNATARTLIETASNVIEAAYSSQDIEQVIDDFGKIFVKQHGGAGKAVSASQIVDATLADIRNKIKSGNRLQGISSGFSELDRMTSGLSPSDLIVLAARPSMGKTALAVNIAVNAALAGHKVLVFSLEMKSQKLVERTVSSMARIPFSVILTGNLDARNLVCVEKIMETIKLLPLKIDDTASLSIGQVIARAKAESINGGVDLIVVDYLQLMSAKGQQSREREVAVISAGLKGLAKDFNIPVLALSQLNRGLENRTDRTPKLSDLRDSGAIEQDADLVLMLHRNKDAAPGTALHGKAELIIAKSRNGPTGSIYLKFEGQFCRFSDV